MLYPYPDILLNPMSLLHAMDHNNNTVAKIDIESVFCIWKDLKLYLYYCASLIPLELEGREISHIGCGYLEYHNLMQFVLTF